MGNLVCERYGNFPSKPPFGNISCGSTKSFGLNTADGCPLSAPPKNGSFFGALMAWAYPGNRDAKAAVRWLRANAETLNIDTNLITAVGSSAGACTVVGLATTFETDFKMEIAVDEDPTLKTTNLDKKSSIAAGLVQWGGMLLESLPLEYILLDAKPIAWRLRCQNQTHTNNCTIMISRCLSINSFLWLCAHSVLRRLHSYLCSFTWPNREKSIQ